MEPFATIDDLQKQWRTLTPSEVETATTKLLYASAIIASDGKRVGIDFTDHDEVTDILLVSVTCDMVKRSMNAEADQASVSQMTESAGPFSNSFTFANPSGDMYMTSQEKHRLGLSRQRAGSISPMIGRCKR